MQSLDNIFLAYDIRGRVGIDLTNEIAYKIGKGLADWLPTQGAIAVGHDMRPDSKDLTDSLISGLLEQGRNVINIGQVTSDMIYFSVGNLSLAGGAMITASHNPGEYNGIKLCREQAKPIGQETGLFEIKDIIKNAKFKTSSSEGTTTNQDLTEDWIQHILSFINPDELKPLRIAVDAGNGMAGKIFPKLEPYVPFKVEEMYFELDGTFPNHIANPLIPENLNDIKQKIYKNNLDLGIAFDGDGDRAVLIDEKGEALSGTAMTALLAKYFLDKQPGSTIIYNAICGRIVPETITQNGGKGYRSRVGHSFIKADMRSQDAIFAGEHSGHYYFRDNFMADSGLLAATIALFIISQSGQKLSELAAPYRSAYKQISEQNFEVNDKQAIIDKLATSFSDGEQDWLDGLTVNFTDSWFNIRPSNTEPLLRLNAEAKTQKLLDELVAKVKEVISNNSKGLIK